MQNEIVSIIIPIYNAENYIEDCLKSVIDQTYKNVEIICIDDCSKDNSISIVKKYLELDNRIKLIQHDENLGPGGARNTGIINSNGKYIYFLDNDDFLDNDYIEKLVDAIKKYNTDIVCNNKILKYYRNNEKKNSFIKKENDFILNKALDFNDDIAKTIMTSSCCKLYKTDFLKQNNFYFPEKLKFEDFAFLHIIKTKIKNIAFIYNSTYYYRQRNNSIIGQYKSKNKQKDSLYIIEYIYNYYKENNILNDYNIPFKWLYKFFKRQEDKKDFFIDIKKFIYLIKDNINIDKYDAKNKLFLRLIINSNSYLSFKIKYSLFRIFL